ncbi:MAG: LytTR family transcriptional regulator [Ignavibacterium sp.]|nr:LytTR family transcriptional regulator [Ignavibacterium sp.]
MDYSDQRDKTIILKEKGKVHQIAIKDIVYVKCESYISTIHTFNRRKTISASILLKDIEEKVNGYGFCRINRNTLVNLKYFDSYVSGKKRCFKTTTGVEMNVSRRKWCILKENIQE